MVNKAVFLDRDGVLVRERGAYNYLPEHYFLNKDVCSALKILQENGYLLVVITNQSGISKGIYSISEMHAFNKLLLNDLKKEGIGISEIYFSAYHKEITKSLCNKPGSLMLEKALARFQINPAKSFMIGDKERDIQAAEKVGVKGILIEENESLLTAVNQIITQKLQ
jgi:D-glycero-D-manno-heptose 1,7-bisphosphate phosphatase